MFPKGRPIALAREDRRKAIKATDAGENVKVRLRSGGQCECIVERVRCLRRAIHIHHRLGGIGVRGRGASALAENKLHLCSICHSQIHAHVLVAEGSAFRRAT